MMTDMVKDIVKKEIKSYEEVPSYLIDSITSNNYVFSDTSLVADENRYLVLPENEHIFNFYGPDIESSSRALSIRVREIKKQKDADIIIRYPYFNENIPTFEELLKSVWNELDTLYPSDMVFSEDNFKLILENLRLSKTLVIALIGVWIEPGLGRVHKLRWLPKNCPDNLYIVTTSRSPLYLNWVSYTSAFVFQRGCDASYFKHLIFEQTLKFHQQD